MHDLTLYVMNALMEYKHAFVFSSSLKRNKWLKSFPVEDNEPLCSRYIYIWILDLVSFFGQSREERNQIIKRYDPISVNNYSRV